MEQYNDKILNIIEEKLPPQLKPVQYLMDALNVSRESAYRRMRGQIPFSLEEAATLCKKLHFSIDQIIGESDKQGSVFFQMNDVEPFSEETIYNYLVQFADDLEFIVKDKNAEVQIVLNHFPLWYMPSKALFELDYCHKMYARKRISLMQNFKDIAIPNKVVEQYERILRLDALLPNVSIILDNNVFQRIVNEIKYAHSINFLTKEDVAYMHDGLLKLLEYYTIIVISGKNHSGNAYKVYLSNLAIDTNITYCTANGSEFSEIWLYDEQKIKIVNNSIINQLHKNWIQSQIRFASLITSSNDILQRDFFQKTYSLINSLLEICK